MSTPAGPVSSPVIAPPRRASRRWLLFVHQLPASPSNLRVRTWRRLQGLGAVSVRQAVYALPDSPATREDFEWLRTEVTSAGGEANVFAAESVDAWSDDALVDEFRRSRQEAYSALAADIEGVLRRLDAARRPRGAGASAGRRLVEVFRERLAGLERIDFFGSAGRDRVATLVAELEERTRDRERRPVSPLTAQDVNRAAYTGRLWVTRRRPGVDRMASAWLIRRFIDPKARFGFADHRASLPVPEAVPFDMYGVAFSHQGQDCTFETLCTLFGVEDASVARIAAIVHDLDLKDNRFGAPDAPTIGSLIEGLQLAGTSDDDLLQQGMTLFESLYRAFSQSSRPARPRPVAKTRSAAATRKAERRSSSRLSSRGRR